MPAAADVRLLDLFGNPVPVGAVIDDQVHYIACEAGPAALQAALGVK